MQCIIKTLISLGRLSWKKKVLWIFSVMLFLFFISVAISPLFKTREFEKMVESDSLFLETFESSYEHPELRSLVREKIYKEALLKLAESDSIQMVINLADSTVNLSIKGVIIHRTKVESYRVDRLLRKMPIKQQIKLLSQPLSVNAQHSTIVKEPVVVRHAPKDEAEAERNTWQPDTLIQHPAFVKLSAEHGIHILLEQIENVAFRDCWSKFTFHNRLRWKNSIEAIGHFISLKIPEYHPDIVIMLPVDDLRAIYRALPDHAFIVIHL